MIAGTLARLAAPVDEPLETWFRGKSLPGLHVERTQTSLEGRPVQQGTAATRIESTRRSVDVGVNTAGEAITLDVTDEPVMMDIVTEWVADVTGSGLIAAESLAGDDALAFPLDLFASRTQRDIERLTVDIAGLHTAWAADDGLGDVWMTGTTGEDEASIQYHDAASIDTTPTAGLGFQRAWNGTVERGVVYESGYLAVYTAASASAFVQFVEDELLEYTTTDSDDTQQTTLGDESGGEA